jgi:hypothetical protein
MKKVEPEALKRGKRFHKLIQVEWLKEVKDGRPQPERYIQRLNGRKGRVDILVEEMGDFVSVVEIKASDWDKMTDRNVVRNVQRQIRQIWSYVEAQLDLEKVQVCPGVIFPKLPRDSNRLNLIEEMFNEAGIQVVWHDESVEHVRERMDTNQEPDKMLH